jgi:WXG100 family type VII secretion target
MISLSLPLAEETAAHYRQMATQLGELRNSLRQQWLSLSASWEGTSRLAVEVEILAMLNQLSRLTDETNYLARQLQYIATNFEAANSHQPLPVNPIGWSKPPL